jgi:glycosyltransferase involved in cell wall biosynthesis
MITSVPLVPPWDQGDKNLALALASALPHIRFQILTTQSGPVPSGCNLDPLPLFRTRYPSLTQKLRVFAWLSASSHRSPPDLYHLVYQPSALSSLLLKRIPALKRVPILHTVPATTEGNPLDSGLFFADRVVALSNQGRETIRRSGVANVRHIPQGIDVDEWASLATQTESCKSRLGVAGCPVVLYPGHYSPGYGIRTLLRALPRVMRQVPDVRVILACRLRSDDDRKQERAIRNEIAEQGMAHAVLFFNTVTDVKALIGASDLVLAPFETLRDKVDIPTTLLESLAAGKPVIISDIPPMNELVAIYDSAIKGGVGLTVPPGDADDLAQAMVALLQGDALRLEMGKTGQALVRDCFDIRHVARQYEELYWEMLS